jgi:hypothetical protein
LVKVQGTENQFKHLNQPLHALGRGLMPSMHVRSQDCLHNT